jgi:hypothetical protein
MFKPLSDEEYVARVRAGVAMHQRWRGWLVGLYGAALVAFLGLAVLGANLAARFGQLAGGRAPALLGFGCGALLGVVSGGVGLKAAHGLWFALSALRTERLLLRYHDALADLAQASGAPLGWSDLSCAGELPINSPSPGGK